MNQSNVRRMIKDESRWLFIEHKYIPVILIIFVIFIFLFFDILTSGYEIFLDKKERFIEFQRFKAKYYSEKGEHLYDGFKVMHNPSQLSFLINAMPYSVYSIVSREEAPVFRDFSTINVFLPIVTGFLTCHFGITFSFIMVLLGGMGPGDKNETEHWFSYGTGNAIIKMIIMDIIMLVLALLFCFISKTGRLIFSSSNIWALLIFIIFSLLLGNFFFAMGNLCRVLFKKKEETGAFIAFSLWLFLIILLPRLIFTIYDAVILLKDNGDDKQKIQWKKEVNHIPTILTTDDIDNKSLKQNKTIKEFEMKEFLKKIEWESEVIERTMKSEFKTGKFSALCPTLYYNYLSHEIAGFSNRAYMALFKHSLKLKRELFEFYLTKKSYKFISSGKKNLTLEEYITPGMLIYNGKSYIPPSFLGAVGIILIYTLILFLVSHWIDWKRRKKE